MIHTGKTQLIFKDRYEMKFLGHQFLSSPWFMPMPIPAVNGLIVHVICYIKVNLFA